MATNGRATAEQLGKAYVRGYWIGAAFGVAGAVLPVATAIVGAGWGGYQVGQAIMANNPKLVLFRALTLSLGISVGARQITEAYEDSITGGVKINNPVFEVDENTPGSVTVRVYDDEGNQAGVIIASRIPGQDAAWIKIVFVEEQYRGQGLSTKLYGMALQRLGWPAQVKGQPYWSNAKALKRGGIEDTPRAGALEKFGYTEHSYDKTTDTMTSKRPTNN